MSEGTNRAEDALARHRMNSLKCQQANSDLADSASDVSAAAKMILDEASQMTADAKTARNITSLPAPGKNGTGEQAGVVAISSASALIAEGGLTPAPVADASNTSILDANAPAPAPVQNS